MKLIAILLLCLSIQACQTDKTEPKRKMENPQASKLCVQSDLKQKMTSIIIPEVDFRQADVADVIAFILEPLREPTHNDDKSSIRTSLVLDLSKLKQEDWKYDSKYSKLKQHCAGKTITLNLRYCSLLNLLDFVIHNYTDLEYEFKGDNIIFRTHDGIVLMDGQTGEPSARGDGISPPQP